jgi:hypothetical protein
MTRHSKAAAKKTLTKDWDDLEAAAVEYARIYVEGPETYSAWELMFDRFIAAAIAMREARKGTVAE